MTRHRDEPSAAPLLRYTLPAPSGTVWLGLPLSSLAGLTVTVTAVVLLLLAGAPIWAGALLTTAGAVVSACPVAGRPLLGWVAPGTRHALARVTGADRWTRPWAATATGSGAARRWSIPLDLGVGPAHLRLSELGAAGTVGALRHGRHGRVTVVLEVIGAGRFGLLDPTAQDSELARWGSSLATLLADPAVASVQWLTHTRPDTRPTDTLSLETAPRADQDDRDDRHDDDCDEGRHHEMVRDYQQLLADVRAQAIGHRHLLAVTFSSGHRSTGRRSTSRSCRDEDPDLLATRVREAATALLGADLLARPLPPAELAGLLRLLLDPCRADHGTASGGDVADPVAHGVLSMRSDWNRCRTDDILHRCYAVAGWPRLQLTADWLAPLLHAPLPESTSRTLSVHARAVPPEQAARRARAAGAKARLDAADRGRLGFTPAAADSFAETDAAATEDELVAGYRMADLSAVVTVSAPDEARLDGACRQLRALAAAQRLDLRPLHGQHSQALAATLPLGLHPGTAT